MKRKNYETDRDRANEASVIEKFASVWNVPKYKKLPYKAMLDYVLLEKDGSIRTFVEIKVRKKLHSQSRYCQENGYWISVQKWMKGKEYADKLNVKFVLIVEFQDGIMYYVYDRSDTRFFKKGVNGRTDRDDWQDIEPVIYIPMDRFQRLEAQTDLPVPKASATGISVGR